MLEIGVQSGGSTFVWNDYFGTGNVHYIGIDINPNCSQFEDRSRNVRVFIGRQSNATFLREICSAHGPFDLIVDNGSHRSEHIMISLYSLWDCLTNHAVYAIEDLHKYVQEKPAWYYGGTDFYGHLGGILRNTSGYMSSFNKMNHDDIDAFSGHIRHAYAADSLMFFHYSKKLMPMLKNFRKGTKWISY